MTDKHGTQDSDPGWHLGDPAASPANPADGAAAATRGGSHPDIEALDAYLDTHPGPPGPGRPRTVTVSRVERHLRGCVACQETVAALHRVRAELARLASMTMPDDVAARIQAALASRSGTADTAGDVVDVEPTPAPRGAADDVTRAAEVSRAGTAVARAGRPVPDAGGPPSDTDTRTDTDTDTDTDTRTGPDTGTRASIGPGGRRSRLSHGRRRRGQGPGRGPGRAGRAVTPGRPPRPGQASRAGDRIPRDWVSIAAACVALLAFGAALLAVRTLTGGGDEAYSTSATSARDSTAELSTDSEAGAGSGPAAAAAPQVPSAVAGSAGAGASGGTMAAAPADAFVLVGDSGEVLDPATVVAHGHALLAGRIAVTRLVWSAAGAPSPRADDTRTTPPRAGESAAGDGRGMADTPASLAQVIDTPQLRMCYDGLAAQTGGAVIALDRVRFDDQPAIMVALSVAGQPASTRLVVLDAHCGIVPAHSAVWYSVNANRA